MQGDHLNRKTLKLCDVTLLNACALQHAGESGHAHESGWDTEHLGKGRNCFNRKREGTGVFQVGRVGSSKEGTVLLHKVWLAGFHLHTCLNMWMVFQPNTWTSHLPELVWPSSERPGLGHCVPCHWGPVQNKPIRPEATHRFCPEFPPECKPALLSLNSIFTYHPQLFQPAVLALLLVTAAPNFRGNALVNFAWSRFWMAWNVSNVLMCI